MNYLVLVAAVALLAIWLIALIVGGVSSWFLWLTLVASLALFASGAAGLSVTKRRIGRPI